MKKFVCIECPKGCVLNIDEKLNVTGNLCIRGKKYAINEVTNPKRMVTSTVQIKSELVNRLSVATSQEIDKNLVFEVIKSLDEVKIVAPIHCKDVIIKNVCDSGADIIATRTIEK